MKTQRMQPRERQVDLPIDRYHGINSFGRHQAIAPGEFRFLTNWDIFPGKERDELKSRRGSAFLKPASGATKWASGTMHNAVTWDVGADEFAIAQIGTKLYSQNLTTPGNPTEILDFASAAYNLGSATAADMFVHGDRLFVFHPSGNAVVEYVSGFKIRAMGMAYPWISGFAISSGGSIVGRYVYAVELVYQVAGGDVLVSSPNRKFLSTGMIANTGTVENDYVGVVISATVLDASSLWTHVRLWRSKNLDRDLTDPLNPIDAQGLPEELYEVALVTRAEINAGALAAVATSGMPVGNANVVAGKPAGAYTIRDNNTDESLFNLIGLERIELVPLPSSACGCFHSGRIFTAGSGNDDIQYSNQEGTKYSELYNPLNIIQTGRDGTLIKRLISFERDLLILKETKTGRILGGDVDQKFEILDHHIGIANRFHADYIPGVGVCAITSDSADFKIFGMNLQWGSTIGGKEVSRPIRPYLEGLTLTAPRFVYINGKILILLYSGVCIVLQAQSGAGWTAYAFYFVSNTHLVSFAGGRRAVGLAAGVYSIEIEKFIDTDARASSDTEAISMDLYTVGAMFQGDNGRQVLEMEWYSVVGHLSGTLYATPYRNGIAWPAGSEVETAFVMAPSTYASTENKDGEYRLYLEPAAIGDVLWNKLQGFFLHFQLRTTAPATIRGEKMRAIVDEDDSGFLVRTLTT